MRIGFIGLGAMGFPMVKNLLAVGYPVTVYDISPAAVDRLTAEGAQGAASTLALAAVSDVVITMLPADKHVKSVLMDPAFAAALPKGATVVDMSSCTTAAIQEVEAWYAPYGVDVVDAPVSGGVEGAAAHTLSIFAAGKPEALARVHPVFKALGRDIFDLGKCGMGKAFKNLNNMITTCTVMVISEVYRIAKKQGYDTDKLYDMIMASTGMSRTFQARFPRMVNGSYEGGFKQSLGRKDLGNAIALGEGEPLPVAKLVHELMLANRAYDDCDMAVAARLFEEKEASHG